jgi:WD40 repeat protein
MQPDTTQLIDEFKHTRPLTSCCWDPLGRFVFFGAEDNQVHRYAVNSRTAIALAAHDSWVRAMAVSPDGQWLVTGGYDGRLCRWPAADQQPQATFNITNAHQGWIRALDISADGKWIATCGNDRLVKVWDAESGDLKHAFPGHVSHVYNVRFTLDQRQVVSCDLKSVVRAWSLVDETQHRELGTIEALHKYDNTFRADIGGARCMAFHPDGFQLALGGVTNVTNAFAGVGEIAVGLWDWEQSKVAMLLVGKEKIRGTAWGVAYHAPGKTWIGLAGGGGGGWLYFWSGQVAEEDFRYKLKGDARGMSLSQDTTRLAVAHADNHLRIYGWDKG